MTNSKKETELKLENINNINKKVSNKLNEVIKEVNEFEKVTSNLYNFFGIIVGVLGFIFVNFQLITSATSLSLGKMIIYMGLANLGLITGIIVILDALSVLLGKRENLGIIRMMKEQTMKFLISLIVPPLIILGAGIGIYFLVDRPENRDIIKRIEKLEGDKPSNNVLGVNINGQSNSFEIQLDRIKDNIEKLQDENEEKDEKIKMLQNEIEVLQKSSK